MNHKKESKIIARVIAQHRDRYRVSYNNQESWAELMGKIIYQATSPLDYPVVGDLVSILTLEYDNSIIESILPRKNILQRKSAGKNESQPIAANIETAFIIQAVDRDFNLNRFERYLTIVKTAKIKPVFILNKCDLITPEELNQKIEILKNRFKDINILTTSILSEDSISTLKNMIIPHKIHSLLGSSGVGKSSLINKLLGRELLKTLEISTQTKKGKHTTTHRELFILKEGGMLIDNPGMREIGLAQASQGIADVFAEIEEIGKECKFSNCSHQHEVGCQVLAAVKACKISPKKYENYLKLKKEVAHYDMTNFEKRKKDKQFGKMIKTTIKQKKRLK